MAKIVIPDSIKEALKEGARVVAIGVVSYLLTEGAVLGLINVTGIQIDQTTKLMVVGFVTTFLRSVDKWLHEEGKDSENKTMSKGLTRF